jgi:hypothetical protein
MVALLAALVFLGLAVLYTLAGGWLILLAPALLLYVVVSTWLEFR